MPGLVTVRSVMSNFPYSIDISAYANSAKTMLQQMNIHHLPVMENNAPVGIVTTRDVHKAAHQGLDVSIGSDTTVRDIYSPNPYIVEPDEALDKILHRMAEEHIDAALVLENDKLIGIFTITDVCKRYAELLQHSPEAIESHHAAIDQEFLS